MTSQNLDSATSSDTQLARTLSNRHIQLIAIGGAIGTGLFMGSGKTIALAGPSILLVYAIIGGMLYLVMRALGELLLSNLNYYGFADFAGDLLGPWAKFFTGWTYWLCWVVIGIADVVAISGYMSFWFPELAVWIPALGLIVLLVALNLPSVRSFGEMEFWFALIKIIAIVALIVIGMWMLLTGFALPDGTPASVAHLWQHGGFFPNGGSGFLAGFQIAVFAFCGIELVGTAAAETKNPEKTLPKAINSIPLRILIFYMGALFIIMTVTPWNRLSAENSPFVYMFSLAGLGIAASVVNFVVITSAASSANSGIYSTSRIIFGLALTRQAPALFGKLSRRQVPVNALLFTCIFLLSGVTLLYAGQSIMAVFTIVTTISAVLFIFIWSIILASYVQYRRKKPELRAKATFRLPGGLFSVALVFVFFAFVLWTLAQQADTAFALMLTPLWFIFLGVVYALTHKRHRKV